MMSKYYNVISTATIIVLILLLLRTCNDRHDQQDLYNATQDTLKTQRNKLGQQVASTILLTATSTKQFLDLVTKDSLIRELQVLVEKQKGQLISATIIGNSTSIDIYGSSKVVPRDTIRINNSTKLIFPEYRDSINNKWFNASMSMTKDSSHLKMKVFNSFNLVQRYEKPSGIFGFMKPSIPTTSVTNLNPYTETTSLRTFTIKCECHNGRWFTLGAVGGVGSVILLNSLIK